MSLSFYDATVKPLIATIKNLQRVMKLSQRHITEQSLDEQALLNAQLFHDMFDLRTQIFAVQMLAGHQGALRIAGISPTATGAIESFADADATLVTLLDDLKRIDAEAYEHRINEPVQCDLPIGSAHFNTALEHMQQWVMPHTYFHVTTAYNILRHKGVPLGKSDFLGMVNMRLEK